MVLFQTLYNNLLSVPFSSRKTENYDGKETFPKQFGILLYAANTRQHFYYEVVTEKWEKWEMWETLEHLPGRVQTIPSCGKFYLKNC